MMYNLLLLLLLLFLQIPAVRKSSESENIKTSMTANVVESPVDTLAVMTQLPFTRHRPIIWHYFYDWLFAMCLQLGECAVHFTI